MSANIWNRPNAQDDSSRNLTCTATGRRLLHGVGTSCLTD